MPVSSKWFLGRAFIPNKFIAWNSQKDREIPAVLKKELSWLDLFSSVFLWMLVVNHEHFRLPTKTSAGSDTVKPLMPLSLAAYLGSYINGKASDNIFIISSTNEKRPWSKKIRFAGRTWLMRKSIGFCKIVRGRTGIYHPTKRPFVRI